MPQTPMTVTAAPMTLQIRPLLPQDHEAILDHFLSLSEEDYYLRFGVEKGRDVERLPLAVNRLLRSAATRQQFLYGGWDAKGEHLLLCLGLYIHDPARTHSLELHMSATPQVRGGLVQALSGWLIGELMKHKATEVIVTYQEGNRPVQRLVEQLGMSPLHLHGVPFFTLKVDAHAQVVETWLQKTDALFAAARQELAEPLAKL